MIVFILQHIICNKEYIQVYKRKKGPLTSLTGLDKIIIKTQGLTHVWNKNSFHNQTKENNSKENV